MPELAQPPSGLVDGEHEPVADGQLRGVRSLQIVQAILQPIGHGYQAAVMFGLYRRAARLDAEAFPCQD